MRLRITGQPSGCIDGIRLDDLIVGVVYDIGTTLGCYLLALGVAEPADDVAVTHVPPWSEVRFAVTPVSEREPPPERVVPFDDLSEVADRPPRRKQDKQE